MHNRNIVFAEIQLGAFHLQASMIDLMFNIEHKVITRNSSISHDIRMTLFSL